MFSSLKRTRKDSDESKKTEDDVIRCSSPRTIALSINQMENGLAEALGVLLAQKQLLVNELSMLPAEDDQDQNEEDQSESDFDQTNGQQSSRHLRQHLNSEIAKLETEMLTLRSGKIELEM
jgi:hypothetical protein